MMETNEISINQVIDDEIKESEVIPLDDTSKIEESESNAQLIKFLNNQNKSLEDILKVQTTEKVKLKEESESLQKTISQLKSELRQKIEHLTKIYEDEKHNKESMVLKFAQAEQKNIDNQKKIKELEGRLRECKYNVDQISQEKEKLSRELKLKIIDFSSNERELNNLKASLSIAEQKFKTEKNRFEDEIEKNIDTKKKHDELQRVIMVLKEENSTLRINCQEIVKKYQNSEDMLSNTLTTNLRQVKEELKKCMEDKKEAIENQNKISSELQINKSTINSLNQELKNLREKIKHVEADRMCQEEAVKQLKDALKNLTFVKDQLLERISNLEPFESRVDQVTQENDRHDDHRVIITSGDFPIFLKCLIIANNELNKINEDNETVVITLRHKESELLEFIQSLSKKNAELQTENQAALNEINNYNQQIALLDKQYKDAVIKINFWEKKFKSESNTWLEEQERITKTINNLTNEITTTNQKLSDSNDQIYSLKKKHKAHIKDLTRQLTKSNGIDITKMNDNSEPHKLISTGSTNSEESRNLDEKDDMDQRDNDLNHHFSKPQDSPTINGKPEYYNPSKLISSHNFEIQMIEPHHQVLVDKIIKLQQNNARLQEKIDFLNEHSMQLTQDIQRKSLLLRYLFSQSEEKGSVKSDFIDDNHLMMIKKGGIMASVFSSHPADESMTLDLSLEINRRLQSVLEDTTIKNFTLKDSINILGEEISKLSSENHNLKKSLNMS